MCQHFSRHTVKQLFAAIHSPRATNSHWLKQPLVIVKYFDILKYRPFSLVSGLIVLMVNQLESCFSQRRHTGMDASIQSHGCECTELNSSDGVPGKLPSMALDSLRGLRLRLPCRNDGLFGAGRSTFLIKLLIG